MAGVADARFAFLCARVLSVLFGVSVSVVTVLFGGILVCRIWQGECWLLMLSVGVCAAVREEGWYEVGHSLWIVCGVFSDGARR